MHAVGGTRPTHDLYGHVLPIGEINGFDRPARNEFGRRYLRPYRLTGTSYLNSGGKTDRGNPKRPWKQLQTSTAPSIHLLILGARQQRLMTLPDRKLIRPHQRSSTLRPTKVGA